MRAGTSVDQLTRSERRALLTLLIEATAAAGHDAARTELAPLVAAAPVRVLTAAARLHRVSGSVRRALEEVPGVPADVLAELTDLERRSAMHHIRSVGALGAIGRAFDDAGLRWALMKGPILAAVLYPGVGDRTYNDLDLLVDRQDYGTAMRILEDLGYEHTIHDWALAERMLAGQVGMRSAATAVDLHWHFHYSAEDRRPFALAPDEMLARIRRVSVSNVEVPTFDAVDTTLTLAFHAARSDGHLLVWFKDVERALAVDRPDLDELVARARRARCAPLVGVVLARTRELLGAPVPDDVIAALLPPPLRVAARASGALVAPIQLHDRPTITRAVTRSLRAGTGATLGAVPMRALRWARNRVTPVQPNDTDDPADKQRYLRAVAAARR